MKKIEAVINRKNYPAIREKLDNLGIDIIDKRNLEDSKFVSQSKGSRVGGSALRSTMLAKIELAMSDKQAREVVDIISKNSGLPKSAPSKIFVFEMQESIELNSLQGESETEFHEEPEEQFQPYALKQIQVQWPDRELISPSFDGRLYSGRIDELF